MRKIITAVLMATTVSAVQAQPSTDYPNKPIRFILISAPGSGGDTLGRLLADKMGPLMQATFVMDNKPGAGGSIAIDTAARAQPDGYTITMGGATTHVLLPAASAKLPYDSIKDFTPIGQVATAAIALVANNDFPANNVKELLALSKEKPGSIQYASWGNGSTGHFCGELLNLRSGAKMEHIPYKSVSQIQTDLYGGHIKLGFVDMASAVPMVNSGRAKAIVTCTSPSASLPGVQSYEEAGIDDAAKRIGAFRWAMYAPAGTPQPIVDKLAGALKATLEMPDVRQRLLDMGLQPGFADGAYVQQMTEKEIAAWKQVAEEASIKLN